MLEHRATDGCARLTNHGTLGVVGGLLGWLRDRAFVRVLKVLLILVVHIADVLDRELAAWRHDLLNHQGFHFEVTLNGSVVVLQSSFDVVIFTDDLLLR